MCIAVKKSAMPPIKIPFVFPRHPHACLLVPSHNRELCIFLQMQNVFTICHPQKPVIVNDANSLSKTCVSARPLKS